MPDLFLDTETYCETPIKWGSSRYAEDAEVMLLSWALDDGEPAVWDRTDPNEPVPIDLGAHLKNPDVLVWFQNGDKFDWPVIAHAMPMIDLLVPIERRRDTMVQAYAHSLPGNLEMMGDALGVDVDKRKFKEGKRLVRLFCMPQKTKPPELPNGFINPGIELLDGGAWRATRTSHPEEWEAFKAYATQDIIAMRECHRRMPSWNYRGKQLALWAIDQRINARGICMDMELTDAAIEASEKAKKQLAVRTRELTDEGVQSATQRDNMLKWILEAHGVDLPDMQAATLERRIKDDDLPPELKELLMVRLEATTTSVAKFTTLKHGINSDNRLRGAMQFRGAGRTGRDAHRLFQPGNMPRPDMLADEIFWAIDLLKLRAAHLVYDNVMRVCSNAIRSTIVAGKGKKLVVGDLKNIEGRFAAWIAGEEWKLEAFRAFDAGTGPDLYIVAYASSFNVPPESVDTKTIEGYGQRQIGKVQELMFQYGGGVGAWITGAATYGIDLNQMTEQVFDTLPARAREEAGLFLLWLQESADLRFRKDVDAGDPEAREKWEARKLKARLGLSEKTFICCDAIKRLWRAAHPAISSIWKELEGAVESAILNPGSQFQCRKLKIRRDGQWLRIGLPSGRVLCYPHPMWNGETTLASGVKKQWPGFSYMGISQYTKQWTRIGSYGGKLFENVVQAAACDQLLESIVNVEAGGYDTVLRVHDEAVCEVPDDPRFSVEELCRLLCSDLGWNEGLPLAADGFEGQRYRK